jgi:hypothetical protein
MFVWFDRELRRLRLREYHEYNLQDLLFHE